ncbi:arylsulfatase B-like isoform X1 [Branchiostoma lanceolatum]|uniref:arylsulfatase B-like isoform X1 n=1 Tax=Branchiostoma lanceolatum TaxID=7740 RepID=UPI0034532FB1
MAAVLLLVIAGCLFEQGAAQATTKPHILLIVADDLGWSDVSWNNPYVLTPNLHTLATNGVIFNQTYGQPTCSPSRAALLTGKFPFRLGMQRVMDNKTPHGLPLDEELLPQKLKKLGYATHMIGKWHLGSCKWEYTPTERGFDSFYGYHHGAQDYYTHKSARGLDFWDGKTLVSDQNGVYSTESFATRAESIISQHDSNTPLFLYMPFQSVHTPHQVPSSYLTPFSTLQDDNRSSILGMATALDDAIKRVTDALKGKGLWDNTLTVFMSDNGGEYSDGQSNWPLRGAKGTLWEGGTRVPAFVHGNMLERTGYTYHGMMHGVDILPTLVSVAGGTEDPGLDGKNMWQSISTGADSPRTEFVYAIDSEANSYAIRVGDYKLITGLRARKDDWYAPAEMQQMGILTETVDETGPFLFNIREDPLEKSNLYGMAEYASIQRAMRHRLNELKPFEVPFPVDLAEDPAADPSNYGNVWMPGWC